MGVLTSFVGWELLSTKESGCHVWQDKEPFKNAWKLCNCFLAGSNRQLWRWLQFDIQCVGLWYEKNYSKSLASRESESEVAQSCPTLCDPMDCSPPGSSIHGILQARTLEWVAISFSRGSSQARDKTRVSRLVGRRFTIWATRDVILLHIFYIWEIKGWK